MSINRQFGWSSPFIRATPEEMHCSERLSLVLDWRILEQVLILNQPQLPLVGNLHNSWLMATACMQDDNVWPLQSFITLLPARSTST